MAKKDLNKIFLSASIPYAERDKRFYDTADIVAIRDAVRALATVVIPKAHLIWGGHPSITPLIRFVMEKMKANVADHITLYQSLFFQKHFPKDNDAFESKKYTPDRGNLQESILQMRRQMIEENDFKAAIFIGGMEGVLEEFELFKAIHPDALVLPVASTGAAAKILFDNTAHPGDMQLVNSYAYMALFRTLLSDYLN
jgi:hypothetical protein